MKNKNLLIILIVLLIAGAAYFQINIRKEIAMSFFKQGSGYFGGVDSVFIKAMADKYNLDKAEKWYKAALKIYPKLSNTHYQLARIYFIKNDFQKALSEINAELSLNPRNQRSYYIRGLINGYSENYSAAIGDFERFIASSPNEWAGYNDLAWVYFENGDYQKAEEIVLRGLEKFPGNSWLLNGLASVYFKTGNSLFDKISEKAKIAARKLTFEDFSRAYPGNGPKLLSGNFNNFKNNIGFVFAPACSASNYNNCSGVSCVSASCDPDHESCANSCGNNIDCGALPNVNLLGPDTVEVPDSVWLNWTVSDADSCAASGEWSGSKSSSGGNEVIWPTTNSSLRGSYNFILTCSNKNGSVSDVQNINVILVPRCIFTANPNTIIPPQYSKLEWDCEYVISCSIDQGIGNIPVNSQTSTAIGSRNVRPSKDTNFTLTCDSLDVSARIFVSAVNVDIPGALNWFRNIIWREVIPR